MRAKVACTSEGAGWSCRVVIGDDTAATRHQVRVSVELLARVRPGEADPTELVSRSFDFLLAREPRESILRSFDLEEIGRYFPDWEATVRD